MSYLSPEDNCYSHSCYHSHCSLFCYLHVEPLPCDTTAAASEKATFCTSEPGSESRPEFSPSSNCSGSETLFLSSTCLTPGHTAVPMGLPTVVCLPIVAAQDLGGPVTAVEGPTDHHIPVREHQI